LKLVGDLHCHTIASGHAYSTIQEIAQQANKKGLEVIAITDHCGNLPGAPHYWYFWNLKSSVPEEIDGVRILKGVEANIIDYNGTIDLSEEVLERLDIVIASFHDPCFEPISIKENTRAVINAIKNPYVRIIGHPDNPLFQVDIDEVVAAAKEYGKVIELNNKSPLVRKGCELNTLKFAEKSKEYGTQMSCGSDAHISFEVGEFDIVRKIIDELAIPEDLILNTSKEKILRFIKNKKHK